MRPCALKPQDLGPLISPTRAHSLVATLVLAGLIGAVAVGCGAAEPLPSAHHDAAASPSDVPHPPLPRVAAHGPRERPNVLVIETDDMRWDDLRWMPNVRRLIQRRGLSFESSFAPYPLCCPRGRASSPASTPTTTMSTATRSRSGSPPSAIAAPSPRC